MRTPRVLVLGPLIALLLLLPPGAHVRAAEPEAQEARPCLAEELSCGLQKPVISDGVRRYVNEEMGLEASFPAGSRVCMSRSGDAARGFYAWYGAAEEGCPERGDLPATFMGIGSSFNALDYMSLRKASGADCRPLPKAMLHGPPLTIAGQTSLTCLETDATGAMTISVYAMAGKQRWSRAPRVIYFASLGTRGEPSAEELAMFRTFLGKLRVGLN